MSIKKDENKDTTSTHKLQREARIKWRRLRKTENAILAFVLFFMVLSIVFSGIASLLLQGVGVLLVCFSVMIARKL
jgi:uncharacterized membrane protein